MVLIFGKDTCPYTLAAREHYADFADLPRASSLCGACHEVCPVDIPIEDLLLRLRARGNRSGAERARATPMGIWAALASEPVAWRAALMSGRLLNHVPERWLPPVLAAWAQHHELPRFRGGAFRRWFRERRAKP